jgi:hypothetical protein
MSGRQREEVRTIQFAGFNAIKTFFFLADGEEE